jgi:hypothetical protein
MEKYEVTTSEKCGSFEIAVEREIFLGNPSLVDPHESYY